MRARIATFLEGGHRRSPALSLLSDVYGRAARPERPLALPSVPVVGVGGATLGGSSVTPVVLALARALDDAGMRAGVVGHGYGAAVSRPTRVSPSDDVRAVGDEALWLARALGDRADVFVAQDRQRALDTAAEHTSIVIADGLLQARPERLALSLLVVEGSAPWGAALCPPAGDLRASKRRLLAAADHVLVIDSFAGAAQRADCPTGSFAGAAQRADCPTGPPEAPSADATVRALAAELRRDRVHRCISALTDARGPTGERCTLAELRARSVGLVLGIARPGRVLAALAACGVDPRAVHLYADHYAGDRSQRRFTFSPASPVELWLATSKCAARLGRRYEGAPVFELSHRVHLPDLLTSKIPPLSSRRASRGTRGFSEDGRSASESE